MELEKLPNCINGDDVTWRFVAKKSVVSLWWIFFEYLSKSLKGGTLGESDMLLDVTHKDQVWSVFKEKRISRLLSK